MRDDRQEAFRWKLTAIAALALLVGYIAGQLAPGARAQGAPSDEIRVKLQLDTTNCTSGWNSGTGGMLNRFPPHGWLMGITSSDSVVYTVCE